MEMKIIKLTKDDLKEMTKSVVSEIFSESINEIKVSDYFDLSAIGKKNLLSIAVDMRIFLQGKGFGSFISENGDLLFEDITETTPINQLRKELKSFGLKQWQIKTTIAANHVRTVILYCDYEKNGEILINEMASLGWSKARVSGPTMINNLPYRVMEFDPMFQKELTKEARKFKFLYHLTPIENVNSIFKKGIEPRSDNDFFSYPPKAHLVKGNITPQELSYLGWQLFNKNIQLIHGKYVIFQINVENLPTNIQLFGDPRFPKGYYSKQTIPPSTLKLFGEINYTDKKKYSNETIKQY